MVFLVTGFGPFGGETLNPSWEAVSRLPDEISGVQIIKKLLPVEYDPSGEEIRQAIDAYSPDALLSVGQAGGRRGLTLERVALNVDDSLSPDNGGLIRSDEPISLNGPAAYFATLPNKMLIKVLAEAGLPASLSNSAGTYVCNHILYAALDHAARAGLSMPIGFLHVPFLPGQSQRYPDAPVMPLDEIQRGLTLCLQALASILNSKS